MVLAHFYRKEVLGMPNFKEKVAFFDIDGTIRTRPLPESLYEILIRDYKYRGGNLEKYQGLQKEIKELRKAYKTSEKNSDELFGQYCQMVVAFAMIALEKYTSEEVREIGRRVVVEYRGSQDYISTLNMINFLRTEGFKLVAISGSPKFLVDAFVKEYDFYMGIGQDYEKDDQGIFRETKIRTFENKHMFVEQVLEKISGNPFLFNREDFFVVAAGDTQGDFSMMKYADKAFVINPSITFFDQIIDFLGEDSDKSDGRCKFTVISERKRRPVIENILSNAKKESPIIRDLEGFGRWLSKEFRLWI